MSKRVFLLLPILLVSGCGRAPTAPGEPVPPIPVKVTAVVHSSAQVPVRVPGVVARREESALAFKVAGVVRSVAVRPGDRVSAGQVLASLDLVEIDAHLEQARSAVEKARRDHLRAEELREHEVISTEMAQDAATGLEQAEAALRIAEFNRRHAVITAPAAGRILARLVEPNELVPANKSAVLFASDDGGWIARAGVPEREIVRLRVGSPATLWSSAQAPMEGEVTQISEATDTVTRTTEVEVALTESPGALRSGSVVDLELSPDPVGPRPQVPLSALVEGEGRSAHLFLLGPAGRTVRRVRVEIEAFHDGTAFLRTELPAESSVVVSGAELLRDGVAVEVVP